MKSLIVEDNVCCRAILQKILVKFGLCNVATNGEEAVTAFREAIENEEPYDLICMDIRMPILNGYGALLKIRELEGEMGIVEEDGVKVIMTTSLEDSDSIVRSYEMGATSYLEKPIERDKLTRELKSLGLIE